MTFTLELDTSNAAFSPSETHDLVLTEAELDECENFDFELAAKAEARYEHWLETRFEDEGGWR